MDSTWSNLVTQIITIIAGLLFTGVSTLGGFYIKKLTDKVKKNDLMNEINRYTEMIENVGSFKLMQSDEKVQTVFMKIKEYAEDNEIKISENELALMVERALQSRVRLEAIGLKIMKLSKNIGDENVGSFEK